MILPNCRFLAASERPELPRFTGVWSGDRRFTFYLRGPSPLLKTWPQIPTPRRTEGVHIPLELRRHEAASSDRVTISMGTFAFFSQFWGRRKHLLMVLLRTLQGPIIICSTSSRCTDASVYLHCPGRRYIERPCGRRGSSISHRSYQSPTIQRVTITMISGGKLRDFVNWPSG